MERLFFSLGAWLAALSVGIGAFGAHGATKFMGEEQLLWLAKGARYQMYHALALFAVAWALTYWVNQTKLLKASGWLFVAGTLLFSASLYIMAFTGINLGYITPVGGIAYVLGWIGLAEAARRG